jgi:hypothetical protein
MTIQAKDPELVEYATEIKAWATRKLGWKMDQHREAGGLAKGGQPHQRKSTGVSRTPVEATLKDHGIDKNLAKRARAAFRMPEDKFTAHVVKVRRLDKNLAEHGDRT